MATSRATRGEEAKRFRGSRASSTSYLLSMLGLGTSRRFAAAIEPLGLAPREYAILGALTAHDGASQTQLGERLGIDPSSMVVVIDRLEEAGLVERRRDPNDRRRHAIHLTERSAEVYAKARELALNLDRENLAPLNGDEREQLHALLVRLASGSPLGGGLPDMPRPPRVSRSDANGAERS